MRVRRGWSRVLATTMVASATTLGMAGPAFAAPVVVTTIGEGATPAGLAGLLGGPGVSISNVSYAGSGASAGSFTGGGTPPGGVIGFESGVVLSTGDAEVGEANTLDSYTGGTGASGSGDADLDALGAGTTTDTTVLEFDVTPNQSTLFFNYVFASDEYNEFTNGSVNDVFGLLVTKAGETTKTNCAVLPDGPDEGTDPDPVSINTVNGGNPFGTDASNPHLFRNNDLSDGGGSIAAEPDGFTVVLQCEASVVAGQANHLKLAISDVGDNFYDSWVFIQAGSISTSSEVCGDGIDNDGDGQVDEGCAANTPPTVDAGGPYEGTEGGAVPISGSASDADAGDTVTTSWSATPGPGVDAGATCSFGNASAKSTTVSCTDDGSWTLTLSGTDGKSPAVTDTATLTLANAAPSVNITAPADGSSHQLGTTVNVTAALADPGANDTHTCELTWGDGSSSAGTVSGGMCTGSHSYSAAGENTVTVTATDDDGASGSDSIVLVAVPEASGPSKVYGKGMVAHPSKTWFAFYAKSVGSSYEGALKAGSPYKKPWFHSTSVTSLTIKGDKACWSGVGSYKGSAGHTFKAVALDTRKDGYGKADKLYLVVKDSSGAVVKKAYGSLLKGDIAIR